MKTFAQIQALAAELSARLKPESAVVPTRVWAEKDEDMDTGEIYIAPATRGVLNTDGYVMDVEEVVLFAKYHDLSVYTCSFETGAGLRLS